MTKTVGSVLFALLLTTLSYAQQYVTVTATPQKKDFFPSENIRVNVKADVQGGYHINANQVSDPDLIPTTIEVDGGSLKVGKSIGPAHINSNSVFLKLSLMFMKAQLQSA